MSAVNALPLEGMPQPATYSCRPTTCGNHPRQTTPLLRLPTPSAPSNNDDDDNDYSSSNDVDDDSDDCLIANPKIGCWH